MLIQVRAKRLPSGSFLTLCDAVVRAAESYGAAVIVNDRADLALMSGAAGAHVGQEDLAPRDVRKLLGPTAIVGYSTHTPEQLEAASSEPVSYIAIGPVFGTQTKATGYEPIGLTMVAEAARLSKGLPVVAIGGITRRERACGDRCWRIGRGRHWRSVGRWGSQGSCRTRTCRALR